MNLNSQATVCTPGKFCATVYGDTAKLINSIVIAMVLFIAAVVVIKTIG